MKRVVPVLFVSIFINLFLFLMMYWMVTGEKRLPEKRADFQGIEFIRFNRQPGPPPEKRRTPPKLPVLQKPPSPKPLPKIPKKPKPKPKKVRQIQPTIEPMKPLLHLSRKPYLGDFAADPPPPPPVEAVPVREVSLEEVVEPVVAPPVKEIKVTEAEPVRSEPKKREVAGKVEVAEAADANEKIDDAPVETPAPPSKNAKVSAITTNPSPVEVPSAGEVEIDVAPLYRIRPRYPRRAVRAKLEGIVKVAFTITKDGSVRNPFIVESVPPKVFDQAALRAIRKWKFRPKQVSGQTVVRRAIQNIRFSLKEAD